MYITLYMNYLFSLFFKIHNEISDYKIYKKLNYICFFNILNIIFKFDNYHTIYIYKTYNILTQIIHPKICI